DTLASFSNAPLRSARFGPQAATGPQPPSPVPVRRRSSRLRPSATRHPPVRTFPARASPPGGAGQTTLPRSLSRKLRSENGRRYSDPPGTGQAQLAYGSQRSAVSQTGSGATRLPPVPDAPYPVWLTADR